MFVYIYVYTNPFTKYICFKVSYKFSFLRYIFEFWKLNMNDLSFQLTFSISSWSPISRAIDIRYSMTCLSARFRLNLTNT